MKKLLALILCVMMFVSVMPTSAFAAGWDTAQASTNAIKDAKDSIEAMYYALAADNTVFSTAKMMHSFADNMMKDLFADVEDATNPLTGNTTDHDDLVKNSRAYLKSILGGEISKYMITRRDKWDNGDGTFDPKAYMNTYVAAVNKALTSEKAQKGLQAFVYKLAAFAMQDSVNDQMEDLRDAILDWNDYGSTKWNEFGWGSWQSKVDVDDPSINWKPLTLVPGWALDADELADLQPIFND